MTHSHVVCLVLCAVCVTCVGRYAGWLNGWLTFFSVLVDAALYPIMAAGSLPDSWLSTMSPFSIYLFKAAFLFVFWICNFKGIKLVGRAAELLLLFTTTPLISNTSTSTRASTHRNSATPAKYRSTPPLASCWPITWNPACMTQV